MDVGYGVGQQQAADLPVAGLAELDVVVRGAIQSDDRSGRARSSPGCSALGQPGTCFWVSGALPEQVNGGSDQFQLGLKLFDPPPGRGQRIRIIALQPRPLPGVDECLAPPPAERF